MNPKHFTKAAIIKQSGKKYYYALYDDIAVGDNVLVTGTASGTIWTVDEIIESVDVPDNVKITAEVMCKVDLTAYNFRNASRKKCAEVKKMLDSGIKLLEEEAKYDLFAKDYPEIAELVRMYRKLDIC